MGIKLLLLQLKFNKRLPSILYHICRILAIGNGAHINIDFKIQQTAKNIIAQLVSSSSDS